MHIQTIMLTALVSQWNRAHIGMSYIFEEDWFITLSGYYGLFVIRTVQINKHFPATSEHLVIFMEFFRLHACM